MRHAASRSPIPGAKPSFRARPPMACLLAVLLLVCSTARAGLFEFTVADERKLGEKFNALVRAKLPMLEDSEISDYLVDVVGRLAKNAPPQPFPLTVGVIQNNALNAFAAPAGYVFVFTGLVLNLNHESELAAVLAHELAHVTQRHIANKIETMQYVSIAQILGMLAGAALGMATDNPDAGSAVIMGSQAAAAQTFLKYSREDERDADQVGLSLLTAAGYRPDGMVASFEIMRHLKQFKGYGDIPTYLSSHPDIPERIGYLKDRIKLMSPDISSRKNDDARFQRIQTLIRARYVDPEMALGHYSRLGNRMTCLDRLGKAIAQSRTKNPALARPAFDEALACGGDDPLFQREAGRFFLKVRDFDRAKDLLRRAQEKNPDDMVARMEYAGILAQEGRFIEAIQLMDRVQLKAPEDPETHALFAQMLGRSGDLFGAHLHLAYAALFRNDREQTEFQMDKAKALARTERQKQAYARLEKIHEKRSEFWKKTLFQ